MFVLIHTLCLYFQNWYEEQKAHQICGYGYYNDLPFFYWIVGDNELFNPLIKIELNNKLTESLLPRLYNVPSNLQVNQSGAWLWGGGQLILTIEKIVQASRNIRMRLWAKEWLISLVWHGLHQWNINFEIIFQKIKNHQALNYKRSSIRQWSQNHCIYLKLMRMIL